jgi:hypothetical protein
MLTIAPPWVRSSLVVLLFLVVGARMAEAQPLTLAWDPSKDTDVTGYTLAIGSQPGQYTQQIDVGVTTEYTFASLAAGTYYFAVRAYSAGGLSSGYSNEVSATIPPALLAPAPVVSCATPDPFVSLGGGTCYNGGWLPPGIPVPGEIQAPPPVSPPPAPPASSVTGCATPDPFAGMGGGTCYNGGWLPPGMPVPGGSSPAAPPPAPAPPPSSGPAPAPVPQAPAACSTPDPFAGMGGGTCYNGGWLPPGMPVPGGSSPAAPPPAPAPPPSSGPAPAPVPQAPATCSTPDPFAGMGGGTCYNGGWLPPGMPVPGGTVAPPPAAPISPSPGTPSGCATPDPFVSLGGGTCVNGGWLPLGMDQHAPVHPEVVVTGTLHVLSAAEPLWLLAGDDGVLYTSNTDVPADMLIDGLRVTVAGLLLSEWPEEGQAELEILVLTIDLHLD